ncbi:hypothetical protein EP98_22660 [Salmonella enterica subsp. enterica]|nr:hypothetical protein [Salmonella enterica subsp. enterica serovar Wandsworth]
MKCITSNRRNKILNQKHLIYFFCLIIILFFITIKNKEHHFSCGSAVGGGVYQQAHYKHKANGLYIHKI